jgi:CRISPR-associated protein Cpf1
LESYESTATAGYDYKDVFDQPYNDIKNFYDNLNSCIYRLSSERSIPAQYIEYLAQEGKIYLFKIYCKDFSSGSKGKKNLHTLYWEMLFDQKNLENVVFKLNGDAKLFYREMSNLPKNIVHKIGDKVPKKFLERPDGTLEPVPNEILKKLNKFFINESKHDTSKESELSNIDLQYIDNYSKVGQKSNKIGIIKDARYTKDQIQFHCSITINFKSKSKDKQQFDDDVLDFLHKQDDVNIIGIDRGERNLIYIVVINKKGEIVDGMQFSLNELERKYEINGQHKIQKVNYHTLLREKEINRIEARKNWQTIENIKYLKEGYLSLVIHQLAQLVIEKNAIIVMEDLTYGFKDSRAKIEKQIYQKFENMLIKKFQYLVTHKDNLYNDGGVLNAYQLTNQEIPSYKSMNKQNGFLFYVPPDYTSQIDPVTGFINLLDTKYTNIKNATDFLNKFDKIYYDIKNEYFRFEFDYKKFDRLRHKSIKINEVKRTKWVLCSHLINRSIAERVNNQWVRQPINVNEKLTDLFRPHGILWKNGQCLKKSICEVNDAGFFEKLLKYIFVLSSLRHTWKDKNGIEHDTIISSVELVEGSNEFYSSENEMKNGQDELGRWKSALPVDADANGAYNIARKGLWLLEQLDKTDDKEKAIKAFDDLKKTKEVEVEVEDEAEEENKTKGKKKKQNKTKKSKNKKKVSQWCPNQEWLNFVQDKSNHLKNKDK